MSTNKKTGLRILLVSLAAIVLIAAGVGFWFSRHYKAIVKERLPGLVARSTDSLYTVSIEDISINLLTRRVSITNVHFIPDTTRIGRLKARNEGPNTFFNIQIPSVEVDGIAWEQLIGDREFSCGQIVVTQPDISITSIPPDSQQQKQKRKPMIERLFAKQIIVTNGRVTYRNASAADTGLFYVEGLNAQLDKWDYKPGEKMPENSFYYAENGRLDFSKFSMGNDGGLYKFSVGKTDFSSEKNTLNILNLTLKPALSKAAFYKRTGRQQEIFSLAFPSIKMRGFNWKRLSEQGQLVAAQIDIANPEMDIYMSRLYAPNTESKYGKYPHQMLQKLDIPVYVPRMNITGGKFKYTEVSDLSKLPGVLNFAAVSGNIANITNMPGPLQNNNRCVAKLQGNFMGKSPMASTFDFDLASKAGAFKVTGYMKDLDAPQVREMVRALAMADMKSLHVTRMDMSVVGDERQATGQLSMQYNDLEMELLKMNKDSTELKKKGFLSFLANKVLLYPHNPMPGEAIRTASATVERNQYKSFFNVIWKAIFEGTQKIAARNENVLKLMQKASGRKEENPGKQKGFFKRVFGGKKDKKKSEEQKDKK